MSKVEYPAYESFKELPKLYLTPYGRMRLSVLPEQIVLDAYKEFDSVSRMPDFERFFEACITRCKDKKIDLGPRWKRFHEYCARYAINKNQACAHAPEYVVEKKPEIAQEAVEDVFWKTEKYKLTPDGIAAMYKLGDPHNPYRSLMRELPTKKYEELYLLYRAAYPHETDALLEGARKDYEAHKAYLNALAKTDMSVE